MTNLWIKHIRKTYLLYISQVLSQLQSGAGDAVVGGAACLALTRLCSPDHAGYVSHSEVYG